MGNIGLIYCKMGKLEQAMKYHKQAFEIDKQIGYLYFFYKQIAPTEQIQG
ncbi:tetratricopeptide repeat protein [Candidatus Desantisbacteria bacterium]|nr:tetratricopeptide repeat protein [Candidatus Desantisbacteria bacterium]